MILVNGNIIKTEDTYSILDTMKKQIIYTLNKPLLDPLIVIEACDKMSKKIASGKYDYIIKELKNDRKIGFEQIGAVIQLLSKKYLYNKIDTELGIANLRKAEWKPLNSDMIRKRRYNPLGTIFHISAGNLDGLPAYCVIEGLLAGNINILKLPQTDKGLSILLLSELIRIEPLLSEYIYVFDTPSNDIRAMKKMASMSDGIAIWGGDEAVRTVRSLASPDKKIIEWGHKISFAYISEKGMKEHYLYDLARHIYETNQLLCSSCQGILLDTTDMNKVYEFCQRFIKIMERVAIQFPKPDIGIRAQAMLQLYNQELEAITKEQRIFKGSGCSIIASKKGQIRTSYMFGNCWAMPLPRENITQRLYRHRGYLQTVGLLCGNDEREELADILGRAGVVRITEGKDMSAMLSGEAHDGDYPLRRYSRIVEY